MWFTKFGAIWGDFGAVWGGFVGKNGRRVVECEEIFVNLHEILKCYNLTKSK